MHESLSDLLADLAAELSSLRHVCLFTATAFFPSLKKDGVASRNQPQNMPALQLESIILNRQLESCLHTDFRGRVPVESATKKKKKQNNFLLLSSIMLHF